MQLEIERPAKTFAKRETPGFVDAATEGRVDDQLHAAAFIEETLGDNGCLGGNRAEQSSSGHYVFYDLLGAGIIEPALDFQPIYGGVSARVRRRSRNKLANLFAQLTDVRREFVCS